MNERRTKPEAVLTWVAWVVFAAMAVFTTWLIAQCMDIHARGDRVSVAIEQWEARQ